jgi:hypothetical protein
MASNPNLGAPASLRTILGCVDPTDKGRSMDIAQDLVVGRSLTSRHFQEAGVFIDRLLANPEISNADLKGMLNRLAGPSWGSQFEFGADPKGARQYLEALQRALRKRAA